MDVLNSLPGVPLPVGPYSQAVKVGPLLFTAGQIAIDPTTGALVLGDVSAQCEQVMRNLEAVLLGAKSSFSRVALTTIFLSDIAFGPEVNKVYSRYVSADAPPARQTVAVKALPMGALVEISVIAECDYDV